METPNRPLPTVFALPLLGAGVIWAWGSAWGDPTGAVAAGFLALLVAGVGMATAAIAPRPGWEALGGTAAAVLSALAVTPGPARGAAVSAVLAVSLAVAASRACPGSVGADWRRTLGVLVPLTLGLQLLARGGVLLDPPGLVRTAVVALGLPLGAALAVTALARLGGGPRALAIGAALCAISGGFWPGTVLALGALAVIAEALERPRRLWRLAVVCIGLGLPVYLAPRLGGLCLGVGLLTWFVIPERAGSRGGPGRGWLTGIGALAFAVALAAGFPWFRPLPLLALSEVPGALFHAGEVLAGGGPPLQLQTPLGWDLNPPRLVGGLTIDSSLALAAGLPAGTPVATVVIHGVDGRQRRFPLRVGFETGEWAARRPGVDAPAPVPLVAWIDPGRFFGQRYRARWRGERDLAVDRIELHRRPDLPPEVEVNLFRLEVER